MVVGWIVDETIAEHVAPNAGIPERVRAWVGLVREEPEIGCGIPDCPRVYRHVSRTDRKERRERGGKGVDTGGLRRCARLTVEGRTSQVRSGRLAWHAVVYEGHQKPDPDQAWIDRIASHQNSDHGAIALRI